MTKPHDDVKQDIIEEAICAGPDGARCGCWIKECPRGCGFALEALDLWKDVKKTLKWVHRHNKNPQLSDALDDIVERIEK